MGAKYANNKANTSNKMEFSKSEFHFSADGHNAFTESIAPQSLRFAASEIWNPEGIAEKILK